MGRDGDLARGNPEQSRERKALGAEGEGAPRGRVTAKPHHVIATEIGTDSRMRVKRLRQQCQRRSRGNPPEPDDGRHLGQWSSSPLHGEAREAVLAAGSMAPRESGGAGGPEATGVSEVRLGRERGNKIPRANPPAAYRSGLGVVKRQVHRSRWSVAQAASRVQARRPRARREPRREAGSSRSTGTRSQAVRSRSRSYASCSVSAASRKTDRRKSELARSKLPHRWRGR